MLDSSHFQRAIFYSIGFALAIFSAANAESIEVSKSSAHGGGLKAFTPATLIAANTEEEQEEDDEPAAPATPPATEPGKPTAESSLSSATSSAAPAPIAQPKLLLWKGTRGKQTVYVLGTIHILQKSFYPLPHDVERALAQSDTLYVEAIAPDVKSSEALAALQKKRGVYAANDRLSKHLSAETLQQLKEYLKWSGELLEMYEEYKPWLVESMITQSALKRNGFKPEHGIDLYLITQAKASNKKVKGIETPESHIDLLTGNSEEAQDRSLRVSIKQLSDLPRFLSEITQMWRSGDADKLATKLLEDAQQSRDTLAAYKKIVDDRNVLMANVLDKSINTDGSSFVAVGSAHVVGPNGIVALLEQKGFKFEQVLRTPEYTAGSASKMKKLSFPEGRFSISLPGNPDMEYKHLPIPNTNLNLRTVFYTYKEPTGNFNVAYMIFPDQVNLSRPEAQQIILNAMAKSFSKLPSKPGTTTKTLLQKPITMLGCPGREILVQSTQPGIDVFAQIRMFVAGQYLYIVIPEGKRAWLNSPAVATFVNSMTLASQTSANSEGNRSSGYSAGKNSASRPSSFPLSSQSNKRTTLGSSEREFQEKFDRARDNFTRDRNASQSRWRHDHGY